MLTKERKVFYGVFMKSVLGRLDFGMSFELQNNHRLIGCVCQRSPCFAVQDRWQLEGNGTISYIIAVCEKILERLFLVLVEYL